MTVTLTYFDQLAEAAERLAVARDAEKDKLLRELVRERHPHIPWSERYAKPLPLYRTEETEAVKAARRRVLLASIPAD